MNGNWNVRMSPKWDHKLALVDLLQTAKFFCLLKGDPLGDLVNLIQAEREVNGVKVYGFVSLSHDRYGITYSGDGVMRADYLGDLIKKESLDVTQNLDEAMQHIEAVFTT